MIKKFLYPFFGLSTITIISFIFLDSFFYSGFTQKHLFIDLQSIVFVYLITIILLSITKNKIFNTQFLKLNRYFLVTTTLISAIAIFLEETNYPNFVFSHFHLNPQILFYLPLVSLIIFLFHDFSLIKKNVLLIITPLVSTYLSQYISFGKFFNFKLLDFNYLVYNLPNFKTISINYILWITILLFFIAIFKKKYQSYIGFLILLILFSFANRYKVNMLATPFTVSDFNLIGDLSKFIPTLLKGTKLTQELIFGIIGISLIYFFLKKNFNQNNPPLKKRIYLIVIPVIIFIFPIFFSSSFTQVTQKIKIENYIPNPIDNCHINGVLFCFYNDLKNIKTEVPDNYNQNKINQIYSELENNKSEINNSTDKPNIIIILSEAFWDPTLLNNVKYSQDPISNVRKDIKSNFESPTFGGGTANVEFELLTGFSNFFLNGISPYSQAIRQPIPSLFSLFKNQGYLTTTIHAYYASAYNRKSVYKNLGLDKFITLEDMKDPQYAGPYISDSYFNQQLINQLNSTNDPQLIYGISMQNHVVFQANRYSDHPIKIDSNLTPNEQDILQSYVDGLHLTDIDYLELKQELNKIDKPVIVIFFGDHLASLGDGTDIYEKAGFDINDETEMHHTPLAIWSNFKLNSKLPSQISPNFLSLEILKLANIKPKYQYSLLDSLEKFETVLNQKISTKLTSEQLNDYQLIQYDLIYGKQYSLTFPH